MAWKFQHPHATLHCGKLNGQVNVATPERGIHECRLGAALLAGRICSVERNAPPDAAAAWPAKLTDAYVRGGDLVATYQANDEWPFAPQLYWRADTLSAMDDVHASVSLLVSVSTHLLDTHPQICAVTHLAADEILHLTLSEESIRTAPLAAQQESVLHPQNDACIVLWRLKGGRLSYMEIAPASDFRELTLRYNKDGTCQARWELIAEFLEKGVIRRTRLDSAFLPRKRDVELAAECCRQFAARPLPLTT